MKTVNDMFNYAKQNNLKLLSEFDADFWQEYIQNSDKYDMLFRRSYFSFKFFLQQWGEDISVVTDNFINEVYNHLMVNKKKYEELHRIFTIADEDYSLVNNYNMKEELKRKETTDDTNKYGSREDVATYAKGLQSTDDVRQVTTYDSNVFNDADKHVVSEGARTDTETSQKGEQNDVLSSKHDEEYTLTKEGNIGVQTVTDMLTKHDEYWSSYQFYTKIFADICRDLLVV